MTASPRMWAVVAFCVPVAAWLVAALIGPKITGTGSDIGWFFDYVDWTAWLRDNLFQVLVLVLLALIVWRVYREPRAREAP